MGKLGPWVASLLACTLVVFAVSSASAACLGVSRTITVSKFNAALGTGPGGYIGLRNKEVVLTFDDGPIPAKTNKILSALSRECTKATFFVVGKMARAYPSTLRNIAARGHTIAFHTHDHANLQGGSLASAQRNIIAGRKAIMANLGKYKGRASRFFRYPYLSRNSRLDQIVKRQGLIPFSASILSQDWKKGSGAQMVNRVMSRLNRQGRGVILLHDIQSKTASALPSLLTRLKRGGYKVVHVRTSGQASGKLVASAKPKKIKTKTKSKKVVSSKKTKKIDRITTASVPTKKTKSKRFSFFKRAKKPVDEKTISIQKQRRLASLARSKALLEKNKKKVTKKKAKKTSKKTASKKSTAKKTARKKVSKKTTKKTKSKFKLRLFSKNLLRQKAGESDAAYNQRLRARRIKLNKEANASKS